MSPWAVYASRKAAWLAANPNASLTAIEAACRRIAEELGL
jgi:hypothetical protein